MIDLKRKIIFIHQPKTAGTTIEAAFGWHPNFYTETKISKETYRKVFATLKHAPLKEQIELIGDQNYNNYFKFATIRNPWDLLVSWYFHEIKNGKKIFNSFEDYLKLKLRHPTIFNPHYWFFYQEKFCIDYIIRFENYREDAETVFQKYGVDWPIENYNTKSRPPNTPYQELFKDPELIKAVEYVAKDYIQMFGYKF